MKPLRPYQASAIAQLREALAAGRKRPVLQAPTGYGKTRLAAEIIAMARTKGRRVAFCVPALSLIDQTIDAFWSEGVRDIGVMQADHPMTAPNRPVQIVSVQTLARREPPAADLVIIDEAHRWHDVYGAWMQAKPDLPFIGLSATPWSKGLGRHYDHLIVSATTRELIGLGYLADFRVYAPAHPDLSRVRTVAGDYKEDELAAAMNTATLVGDIVSTWQEKAEGRPTLVFAVDRAHAKHLQTRFRAAGVTAEYQDAYTGPAERRSIRARFASGEVPVVCNVGTLTTGVDWDVRCIVLARPTKSEMLFVQIVGRGLRTAPGKDHCLILDHSDNHARLGFVTDIHYDRLDDGKPKKKKEARSEPLPRECPRCRFVREPRLPVCPACGYEAVDPMMTDIGGALHQIAGRKPGARIGALDVPHRALYAQLKTIGLERGYKPGWAALQFKLAAGRWPDSLLATIAPEPVSPAVQRWVRERLTAYAKQQKAS